MTNEDRIEEALVAAQARGVEELKGVPSGQLLVMLASITAVLAARNGPVQIAEDLRDLADSLDRGAMRRPTK